MSFFADSTEQKYSYLEEQTEGREEESCFMLICRATVECVYWIFLPIELHSVAVPDHRFDFEFQEQDQIPAEANFARHNATTFN